MWPCKHLPLQTACLWLSLWDSPGASTAAGTAAGRTPPDCACCVPAALRSAPPSPERPVNMAPELVLPVQQTAWAWYAWAGSAARQSWYSCSRVPRPGPGICIVRDAHASSPAVANASHAWPPRAGLRLRLKDPEWVRKGTGHFCGCCEGGFSPVCQGSGISRLGAGTFSWSHSPLARSYLGVGVLLSFSSRVPLKRAAGAPN